MPDPDLFDRVLATAGFSVGIYGVGRASGNEVIRVGYPVVDDAGTVIGAVYAGINVTWLNTAISQWQLGEKATIDITDRNGILIARHPDPRGVGQPIADSLKRFLSATTVGATEVTGAGGVVPCMDMFRSMSGTPRALPYSSGATEHRSSPISIDRSG